MKKIISVLMVTSMLALAAIPVLADDAANTGTPAAQTAQTKKVQTQTKHGSILDHLKEMFKQQNFKAANEKIKNLEKSILELKARDNKLSGLSKPDSEAALKALKDEFKSLRAARELTSDEKDKLKSLTEQIKQIAKSKETKEQKLAEIKPLKDQMLSIFQAKKEIYKQQITKLENERKALQDSIKSKTAAKKVDTTVQATPAAN